MPLVRRPYICVQKHTSHGTRNTPHHRPPCRPPLGAPSPGTPSSRNGVGNMPGCRRRTGNRQHPFRGDTRRRHGRPPGGLHRPPPRTALQRPHRHDGVPRQGRFRRSFPPRPAARPERPLRRRPPCRHRLASWSPPASRPSIPSPPGSTACRHGTAATVWTTWPAGSPTRPCG